MTDEKKETKPEAVVQQLPTPQPQKIDAQQIQQAAAAGVNLLADKDLKVSLAEAGSLQMLRPILMGLAQGQLAVVGAEDAAKLKEQQGD